MAPLAALPRVLREEVLGLCADVSPSGQSYRRDVVQRAGPFRPSGFPEAIRPPRQRLLALAGVAAAAGVLIAIVATGIITVLALSGSHRPDPAAAARSGSPSGTASAPVTASTGSAKQGIAEPLMRPRARAGGHQCGASGSAGFGLADQGEAVTVGHVVGASVPDTGAKAAHAHADTDTDGHRHADAHIDLYLHCHADAVLHVPGPWIAAAAGALLLSAYLVLVSPYVVPTQLCAGSNYG